MKTFWVLLGLCSSLLYAQQGKDSSPLALSEKELADSIGVWQVTTEFLNADGSVAKVVAGSYAFEWVVPKRVVMGKTAIPELDMAAGILFYINEAEQLIEMVSVGKDGKLWVMAGPLGQNYRTTIPFAGPEGKERQLRFTRYNVTSSGFESNMEYSDDGGSTWAPGNHQVFKRES